MAQSRFKIIFALFDTFPEGQYSHQSLIFYILTCANLLEQLVTYGGLMFEDENQDGKVGRLFIIRCMNKHGSSLVRLRAKSLMDKAKLSLCRVR